MFTTLVINWQLVDNYCSHNARPVLVISSIPGYQVYNSNTIQLWFCWSSTRSSCVFAIYFVCIHEYNDCQWVREYDLHEILRDYATVSLVQCIVMKRQKSFLSVVWFLYSTEVSKTVSQYDKKPVITVADLLVKVCDISRGRQKPMQGNIWRIRVKGDFWDKNGRQYLSFREGLH